MAAAIARPTPVLPEVGSTIVPPGFSFPSRSAASIIGRPMRSLTEPPGFRYSSFARICAPPRGLSLSRRTMGVAPTSSRMLGYARATLDGHHGARLLELASTHEREAGRDRHGADRREHPEPEREPARLRLRRRVTR